jgi:hypothetical protein
MSWGKISGDSKGALTRRGIGFQIQGTGNFEIQAHDGTSLTNSTNGTTGLANINSLDVDIYSDGAGNLKLYINGGETASCTGGPTGDGTSTANIFMVEIENVALATAGSACSFGSSYIFQTE